MNAECSSRGQLENSVSELGQPSHGNRRIGTVPRVVPSFSRTQVLRCAALTAAVAASLGTGAEPASAARTPAVKPVRAWQVLAPGWTQSNKELGRVDDIVRVGRW